MPLVGLPCWVYLFLCDDNDGDDDNEFNCLFRVGPFSYSSFSDDPIILIMAEEEKCRSVMLTWHHTALVFRLGIFSCAAWKDNSCMAAISLIRCFSHIQTLPSYPQIFSFLAAALLGLPVELAFILFFQLLNLWMLNILQCYNFYNFWCF